MLTPEQLDQWVAIAQWLLDRKRSRRATLAAARMTA